MTPTQALQTLTKHPQWRRYTGDIDKSPEMQSPRSIGQALDIAIKSLEKEATIPLSASDDT